MASNGPPDKSARQRCWTARDLYFKCLDENDGLWLNGLKPDSFEHIIKMDPTQPPLKSANDKSLSREQKSKLFMCQKSMEFFKSECLPSWSNHFSMLRVKEKQTEAMKNNLIEKEKELNANEDEFWQKVSASK